TELAPIYAALGQRLATQYLLQYRSTVAPTTHVQVQISVDGVGAAQASYTAPTPSEQRPFHRSFASRFVLSPASLVLLVVLVALPAGWLVRALLERRRPRVVERVVAFSGGAASAAPPARRQRQASRRTDGWLAGLERDLEIARVEVSAGWAVVATAAVTVVVG